MSLGNVLGAAAPIAAGFAFPGVGTSMGLGAGIGAGALAGAGIAALTGDDILMGTAMGGLGGYGGGNMATAAQSAKAAAQGTMTDAAANKLVQDQALKQAGTGITSGIQGPTGQLGANMNQTISQSGRAFPNIGTQGASQGATIGQAYKPDFMATASENFKVGTPQFGTDYSFSDVVTELGEGDMTKGAIKTGMTALPVGVAALTPDYDYKTSADNPMTKYDPSRRLDLSMDTGIDDALSKDSGLRLLANGGYLDGGMLPGDGMSDDVPAMIDGTQQAALSQGEFVVPADVVSHLGNGSSDAGSQRLYKMMDEVRRARTGRKEQGKEINAERYMPN
tara:strand:- start:1896 stop:2903 length:1008 start_codon:yes stop_codon:yes gene_type:complete